jgi:RNA polymerase sigma-70 factor (ECF subfamily)
MNRAVPAYTTTVPSERLTLLLHQWVADGDEKARDELVPLVYDVLRRLAGRYLAREQRAVTLQPTALVHEAYLRLIDQRLPDIKNRTHFYGIAAQVMRQILVDHGRARRSEKRGGGMVMVELTDGVLGGPKRETDVVALNDALNSLSEIDARKSRIIELRYFGGFTEEETAEFLALSARTVRREARLAEAWLHDSLHGSGQS